MQRVPWCWTQRTETVSSLSLSLSLSSPSPVPSSRDSGLRTHSRKQQQNVFDGHVQSRAPSVSGFIIWQLCQLPPSSSANTSHDRRVLLASKLLSHRAFMQCGWRPWLLVVGIERRPERVAGLHWPVLWFGLALDFQEREEYRTVWTGLSCFSLWLCFGLHLTSDQCYHVVALLQRSTMRSCGCVSVRVAAATSSF